MSKLEVGQRVVVYGWVQMHHQPYRPRCGGAATVVWVSASTGDIHVKFDAGPSGQVGDDDTHYQVHPKQCRRLKKKERRRVWVDPEFLAIGCAQRARDESKTLVMTKSPTIGWVEMIEAKRRKA